MAWLSMINVEYRLLFTMIYIILCIILFLISKHEQNKTIKKPDWYLLISKLKTINDTDGLDDFNYIIKHNSGLLSSVHYPIISDFYNDKMVNNRLAIEEALKIKDTTSLINKISSYNKKIVKLKSLIK